MSKKIAIVCAASVAAIGTLALWLYARINSEIGSITVGRLD